MVFNVVTVFSSVAMVFSKHHQALLHVVFSCTGVGFKRYHRLFKCCYGLFQASIRSFKRYYTWSVRALVLVSSVTTVFSSAAAVFSKHHGGLSSVTVIVHSWSRTTLSPSIETCTAHGAVQTNHQPVGQFS